MINFFELYQNSTKMERERKKDKDGKKKSSMPFTLLQNPDFCSKINFSINPIYGGKIQIQCWSRLKIKIEFLDKN